MAQKFCLLPAMLACLLTTPALAAFTDNGDGTVSDTVTGLMWQRCAKGMTWTGSTCSGSATKHKWGEAVAMTDSFAGHTDWRLPDLTELQSLVKDLGSFPSFDTTAFPNSTVWYFWSGTPYNSTDAWFVNFYSGQSWAVPMYYSLYAQMVRSPTAFAFTVTKTGSGSGTVTSNTAGINCGSSCSASFTSGASVTLTATPDAGNFFAGWSGACSGAGSCVVTMDAAKNVTATFKPEPFVATTVKDITATSATITTKITFDTPDVGKSGAVYITAWVPSSALGALGILAAPMNHALSVTTTHDNPYLGGKINTRQETLGAVLAAADPNAFVLVQLTSTGWQLVENGQLIPYVSGVLGDSMAALSILNNANPANLAGAQFCVGYGTSAAEMIASGRMIPVATIDSGSTVTTSGSCNVAASVYDRASEFYHAEINHYFMTAYMEEAASLDSKPEWNWARTSKTFNVWLTRASAPSNASPVCRFFGVFANGTVGSHFYTADAEECANVKSRLDWGWNYEGDAFYAVKPTGSTCPSGTSPVYRVYNNGMGGAPNHRYMASQTDVATMVSQGWVSEGTGLAFCGAQ